MEAVVITPHDLQWTPVMEGVEMAVLAGNPASVGTPYVVRFRTDREIRIPLHWHPETEHVTVLEGPFLLSVDEPKGRRDLSSLEKGSYAIIPAGVRHMSLYRCGTLIQVSGTGPFESFYEEPATD